MKNNNIKITTGRQIFIVASRFRAIFNRILKPKDDYFLARSLNPISNKFGFDRGKPIDRYYIEKFLKNSQRYIRGHCLEIHDNNYTLKYGKNKVTKSDVLDIDTNNKLANIYGDLRRLNNIKDNTYDCLLITHTLGMIDDYESAIKECWRILKPSGTLIATVSSIGPVYDIERNYWRFTEASIRYIFKKYFNERKLYIHSYGNILSAQAFWVGLSTEELTNQELNYNDPHFSIIIALRATKTKQSKPKATYEK